MGEKLDERVTQYRYSMLETLDQIANYKGDTYSRMYEPNDEAIQDVQHLKDKAKRILGLIRK